MIDEDLQNIITSLTNTDRQTTVRLPGGVLCTVGELLIVLNDAAAFRRLAEMMKPKPRSAL
jgi:hypothetical protein